jgi:hypothetical protein
MSCYKQAAYSFHTVGLITTNRTTMLPDKLTHGQDQHKYMGIRMAELLQHADLFLPGLLGQILSVLTREWASVAHEGAGQSHVSRQSR